MMIMVGVMTLISKCRRATDTDTVVLVMGSDDHWWGDGTCSGNVTL